MSEQQTNTYQKVHFAVMAIEACAQKACMSGKAMYDRLKRQACTECLPFDDELAKQEGIRFKSFPSYNLEWLKYVVDCRRGRDISSDYDVVEGGVANDNVIDTVEDCPSLNMVYS